MFSLRALAKTLAVLVFAAPAQAGPIFRDVGKTPADAAAGMARLAGTDVAKRGGGGGHHAAAHRSVHHSAPRHVAHRTAVKHAVHKAVVHHKQTRTFRKTNQSHAKPTVNINVNRPANRPATGATTGIGQSSAPAYATRSNYRRPNTYNGYYNRRHGYQRGMYAYRHHHYRRRSHNQNVVRGIVEGTNGTANNGTVQVKVLSNGSGRFRNNGQGAAVAANNGNGGKNNSNRLRNFLVNNNTSYQVMSGNPANFRNGSFQSLKQGAPVLLMLRKGASNQAQAVEMFPMNRQLAAKQLAANN